MGQTQHGAPRDSRTVGGHCTCRRREGQVQQLRRSEDEQRLPETVSLPTALAYRAERGGECRDSASSAPTHASAAARASISTARPASKSVCASASAWAPEAKLSRWAPAAAPTGKPAPPAGVAASLALPAAGCGRRITAVWQPVLTVLRVARPPLGMLCLLVSPAAGTAVSPAKTRPIVPPQSPCCAASASSTSLVVHRRPPSASSSWRASTQHRSSAASQRCVRPASARCLAAASSRCPRQHVVALSSCDSKSRSRSAAWARKPSMSASYCCAVEPRSLWPDASLAPSAAARPRAMPSSWFPKLSTTDCANTRSCSVSRRRVDKLSIVAWPALISRL